MYELIYSPDALKQLEKLDRQTKERIINSLERIRINPKAFDIKKLIGIPGYRFRVGDYRVIVDINDGKLLILVIKVGHRKNIYN